MHQTRRPAVLRGLAASSVAVFAALAGHVTAGGTMPGLLGIAVPWALSFMVCVLLAGRRLSVIRLSVSVAISQFLFHTLFVLGMITPTGTMSSHAHLHGGHLMVAADATLPAALAAGGMMWFGHAIAGLVTIAALHRGERLLLALRDLAEQSIVWLRRRIDAVIASPLPQHPSLPAPTADTIPLRGVLLLSPLRGRAPPRRVAF